jgi:hypothetical protein
LEFLVAGKQSKTARASVRAASSGGPALQALGDIKYLIPLNHGRNAYVRNIVVRRTLNLRTDSEAFVEEIRSLTEAGHGAKIRAEIEALTVVHPGDNWDLTLKRLVESGVLG